MPPNSRGPAVVQDADHPGAGTLFVHGQQDSVRRKARSRPGSRPGTPIRFPSRPGSGSRERDGVGKAVNAQAQEWPPKWESLIQSPEETVTTVSPDALLERGIAEYTFLLAPEGLLGRGKFSTVYKVLGQDGRHYALKHTPLHPHHPLIAARLLREPTLLAQLPPHPCLVGVEGWIRTDGHFYLVETYATSHIPLHAHPLPLRPSRAAFILDQLVSVVRDCLHRGKVCHRDLKGENVLVDVATGEIVVLDLGLATQFSASEAKLTTCCGSPAFHSPEIVNALNHPPGVISYYGPELDIWCIALTLLSLLLNVRFPLGPSHSSRHTMAARVKDRLQELDEIYPRRDPTRSFPMVLTPAEHSVEVSEWARVRQAMADFLEIDGIRRWELFRAFKLGEKAVEMVDAFNAGDKRGDGAGEGEGRHASKEDSFKQTSFIRTEVKYTLPLHLLPPEVEAVNSEDCGDTRPNRGKSPVRASATPSRTSSPMRLITPRNGSPSRSPARQPLKEPAPIILANPVHESDRRVLSYIKYLLRIHGILYHAISPPPHAMFQLVVPLAQPMTEAVPPIKSGHPEDAGPGAWIASLFRRSQPPSRSASVPPRPTKPTPSSSGGDRAPSLRCFVKIEFQHPHRSPLSADADVELAGTAVSGHTGAGASRPNLARMNSRRSTATQYHRRRRKSNASIASRSPSLAPQSASRATTRSTASTAFSTLAATASGEGSLAIASLQHALLQISAASSPSVPSSPATSPRMGSEAELPPTASVMHPQAQASTHSYPRPGLTPLAPLALTHSRPSAKRAASTPRLSRITDTDTDTPPNTHSLHPHHPHSQSGDGLPLLQPLSPLSRQASLTSSASTTHSTPSPPSRPRSRVASRPSSRVNSRAPSRTGTARTAGSGRSTGTTSAVGSHVGASSSEHASSSAPGSTSGSGSTNKSPPPPFEGGLIAPASHTGPSSSGLVSAKARAKGESTVESDLQIATTSTSAVTTRHSTMDNEISRVVIRVSDARAISTLREALDVQHIQGSTLSPISPQSSILVGSRLTRPHHTPHHRREQSTPGGYTASLPIVTSPTPDEAQHVMEVDEEGGDDAHSHDSHRGRPRSKDDQPRGFPASITPTPANIRGTTSWPSYTSSSSAARPGDDQARSAHREVGGRDATRLGGGRSELSPASHKRDMSRGRKLLQGLFGMGGGLMTPEVSPSAPTPAQVRGGGAVSGGGGSGRSASARRVPHAAGGHHPGATAGQGMGAERGRVRHTTRMTGVGTGMSRREEEGGEPEESRDRSSIIDPAEGTVRPERAGQESG